MKSLLVATEAIEPPGSWYANLAHAAGEFVRVFGSVIEVVGIEHPDIGAPILLDGQWDLLEALRSQSAEKNIKIFRRYFEHADLHLEATWAGVVKPGALGSHARMFDLTLMARPEGNQYGPSRAPVENVLIQSGRPLLLMPDWDAAIGTRVVISWIDTPETARAVQFSMPFLTRAEGVYVLAIKKGRIASDQAHGIARGLEMHGVKAVVKELLKGESVAKTTLDFASEVDADMLVKGAYAETRLARFVFGDTTDHLILNARIPLFLAH